MTERNDSENARYCDVSQKNAEIRKTRKKTRRKAAKRVNTKVKNTKRRDEDQLSMRSDTRYNRISDERSAERVSVRIPLLITVLVFIVVSGTALALPVFDVTEVYCEGNVAVKTEDIITTAQLSTGKNIFLESVGGAKRRINGIYAVKNVEIRRVFPNKICISIEERTPVAYAASDDGTVLISDDGVILAKYNGDAAEKIAEAKTPSFSDTNTSNTNTSNTNTSNTNTSNTNTSNSGDNSESEHTSGSSEHDASAADYDAENETRDSDEIVNVPLVNGIILKNADEGETAKSDEREKLNDLFGLLNGLRQSELINRTTYINTENTDDITLVIENRIEVQLGKADNIEYRCRFLAEIINTKLSATETVILDYRGNDVYAVTRDDGGDRVKKSEKTKESDKESDDESNEESDISDSEDTKNENSKSENSENRRTQNNGDEYDSESFGDGSSDRTLNGGRTSQSDEDNQEL